MEIGSRNERPMTRYFPELVEAVKRNLPGRCVIDGEIVVVVGDRLEFEVLQQRIHPAASRVKLLSRETPATFIAFDLLALDDTDYMGGRSRSAGRLSRRRWPSGPPHPPDAATRDVDVAREWFAQFEGAGLDGVVAKPLQGTYQPDKRVMFKIKHERTADCVVAGYRIHKSGPDSIGSLLLASTKTPASWPSVGVIGAFPAARRKELFAELQPLVTTFDDHPWAWAKQEEGTRTPRSSEFSRWNVARTCRSSHYGRSGSSRSATSTWRASVPAYRPVQPLATRP